MSRDNQDQDIEDLGDEYLYTCEKCDELITVDELTAYAIEESFDLDQAGEDLCPACWVLKCNA